MEQNKTGKYLKYAIGEIVLVVIGILIALSINNWNEDFQKKEQERVYYCKIKEDLQTDKNNIKKSIESLNERISSAKKSLANLYNELDDKSIILEDYLSAIRSYHFTPSKSAIIDITSSGKLENLKNSKLKSAILQHYSDLDYAMNTVSQNRLEVNKFIFSYEDLNDFGLQQLSLYKENFGNELLIQMPNINWQKDKNNIIYKQFQEHMTISIIICAREKDLLQQVFLNTEKLELELDSYCDNIN